MEFDIDNIEWGEIDSPLFENKTLTSKEDLEERFNTAFEEIFGFEYNEGAEEDKQPI